MNHIEYYNKNIPNYYNSMYLDGYSPDEIMCALRQKMKHKILERQNDLETNQDLFDFVTIKSEVKLKR